MESKRSAGDSHGHYHEYCEHDIFLSHSGAQKGFVRDLVESLTSLSYRVFFDQEHHSLPPGQDFPRHIFSAANTCSVALLVLSEEFVKPRWPMTELCAFADRLSASSYASAAAAVMPLDKQLSLVPLFYKLSLREIKNEDKVKEWRKVWKEWEANDERISVLKCEVALTKLLPRLNGVTRKSEREQGEKAYIDTVVDAVFDISPPRNYLFGGPVDPNKCVGAERLCQVILDEFPELEQQGPHSSSQVGILGMYGLPGSGKSTLCRLLCRSMLVEFKRNVLILELPTIFNPTTSTDDAPLVKQQLTKFLSKFSPQIKNFASMDVTQLYDVLRNPEIYSRKMFLVVDNICVSNYHSYKEMVLEIVCSRIVGSGSKVMLVSPSRDVLGNLERELDFRSASSQRYEYARTEVPCLFKEEAIQLMRQHYNLDRTTLAKEKIVTDLLSQSSFRSSFMYIPMVFQLIGVFLRENNYANVRNFCKLQYMVDKGKKSVVQELVGKIFEHLRQDLRDLFLDIALFIIPAGYRLKFSELNNDIDINDAVAILCMMHTIHESAVLQMRIKELQKHCLLSLSWKQNKTMQKIQFMTYLWSML